MKKCPFCGAVIEENARFCLYCMKELDEKAIIDEKPPFLTKRRMRLILICAAALLIIAALLILLSSIGTKQTEPGGGSSDISLIHTNTPSNNAAGSPGQIPEENSNETANLIGEAEPSVTPSSSTGSTSSISITPSAGNTPSQNRTPDSGSASSPSNTTSTISTPSTGNTSSAVRTPTSGKTPTPGKTSTPANISGSGSTPSNSTPPSSQTPAEQIVYTYRAAEFYDIIPAADRANKDLLAQNAVVITGVETVAKSGVYVIPEQIDGKNVIAVMGTAFSDTQICATVKKVIFPAGIHSVWETFQYCENLTDLYFSGKSVDISTYMFLLIPNPRQLTVHGASDCVCYFGSNGKSTLKERAAQFGITYQNWNSNNGF